MMLAGTFCELGDKEQAIASLQKDLDEKSRNWGWTVLKINPNFDLLRDDPRFQDLVNRVGLK